MTDATATERTERCDVCRSWQAANTDVGTCHRHAPQPEGTRGKGRTRWPRTMADEWCGEFELVTTPPQGD